MTMNRPPRAARRLLELMLPAEDAETIAGDLDELFASAIAPALGARRARRWYWRQVVSILAATTRERLVRTEREPHHEGAGIMGTIRQDVAFALRALGKQPGFTAIAVATLALGIGANIAIFSILHALLLKPMPFQDTSRLMFVHMLAPASEDEDGILGETLWSYPKYRSFRERQEPFESTAVFASREWSLTDTDEPERLRGELVGSAFHSIVGATPVLGRGFLPIEEVDPAAANVVVIGHGLWTRRFGGDPGVIGRSISLNKIRYTVVGVTPRGFRGLSGVADIWVPILTDGPDQLEGAWSHSYFVIARLKPGVEVATAKAQVRSTGDAVGELYHKEGRVWSASATLLDSERTDPIVRRALYVLLGAVGAVLLIGCANLASLMIARTLSRRREIAVRLALGASRVRIVRQFLTEALLLSLVGAAAGLGVGWGLLEGARSLIPDINAAIRFRGTIGSERAGLTRAGLDLLGLDLTTLLVAAAIGCAAAMLFGLLPAWQASRQDLTSSIKAGGAGSVSQGSRGFALRYVLVAAEIAVALVLVVGSGLMLRTIAELDRTPLGFDPGGVTSVRFSLPASQYAAPRSSAFFEQLIANLRARGEVEDAGYGWCAPVSGGCNGTTATFPDEPAGSRGTETRIGVHWVSSLYFRTLKIPVIRGRGFTDQDRTGQPKVVVINETAARTLWNGADPIGRRIGVGQGGFRDGAEVVGIVRDVRYRDVETPPNADVYLPLLQSPRPGGLIFVRGRVPVDALVPVIASEVRALDRDLPLIDVRTMERRAGDATWRTRALAWLLSVFGGLALLLAAIGVFGVMSQAVEQRTREIGVRVALGAAPRDIVRLIVSRAANVSIAGVAAGFALSLFATRSLASLLYEVEPGDPATFWTVAIGVFTIAVLASYLPARRAARVDPLVTMRQE